MNDIFQSLTAEKKMVEDGEKWTCWLDKYAARLEQEVKDVEDLEAANQIRVETMNKNNPRYLIDLSAPEF